GIPKLLGDKPRVIVAKGGDRRIPDPIEGIERTALVVLAGVTPGDQKRRRHISRPRVSARQLRSGGRVLSLFDSVSGGGQAREVVGRVAGQKALGEHVGALLVAVGQRRRERPLEEIGIPGIDSKRL